MRTPQKVAMAVQAEEAELAELAETAEHTVAAAVAAAGTMAPNPTRHIEEAMAETAEHTVAAAVAAAQIISITQGTPLLAELAANMVVTADEEH